MDIRSLRYFVETVRLSSFTQAAEVLNVTQSTISKMVHQLEEQAGANLLVKDGRKLTLTDTGRVVFERGEQMLALMQCLQQEIADTKKLRHGRLNIGIPPMVNTLLTPALKLFRDQYPKIELVLNEAAGQEVERKVADGSLEIGLTVMPVAPALGLLTRPLASHPVWAVASHGTFASHLTALPFRALRDIPLVMLSDEFALTRRLLLAFDKAGFQPRIAAQSGQWDWLFSMAIMGIGVALLPEPFVKRMSLSPQQPFQALPISSPALTWEVAHIYRSGSLSRASQAWLATCDNVAMS